MSVRAVDEKNVHAGFDEHLRALLTFRSDTDGRTDEKSTEAVFHRVRINLRFQNIFDRDQTLEIAVLIDDRKFLDSILFQNRFCLLERRSFRNGHERKLRHSRFDQLTEVLFKTQIAIGENPDELQTLGAPSE